MSFHPDPYRHISILFHHLQDREVSLLVLSFFLFADDYLFPRIHLKELPLLLLLQKKKMRVEERVVKYTNAALFKVSD